MNIIVRRHESGLCYCRPDTTCEKESRDFYVPESITDIQWSPVLFVRISKAGKCIGKKFVSRYYDTFSFGALMYCSDNKTGFVNDLNIAFSSCVDHSSLLPSPTYGPTGLESGETLYKVRKNGETIYSSDCKKRDKDLKTLIEDTVCLASQLTSLRIGDLVAVELADITRLASRDEKEISFEGEYGDTTLFAIKIVF